MTDGKRAPGAVINCECQCLVCGKPFSYEVQGPGRRRRFCSPDCKRERHKLKLRQYAAEDRYGVRGARLDRRDQRRGDLLPLDLPNTTQGKTNEPDSLE